MTTLFQILKNNIYNFQKNVFFYDSLNSVPRTLVNTFPKNNVNSVNNILLVYTGSGDQTIL